MWVEGAVSSPVTNERVDHPTIVADQKALGGGIIVLVPRPVICVLAQPGAKGGL